MHHYYYKVVSLQLLILMTGNYNFFNLLTIVLCFSLIDDYSVHRPLGRGARKQWQKTLNMLKSSCGTLLNLTAFAVLAVFSYKYFSFSISDGVIFSKINFTKQGFAVYVYYATGVSIWVAISSLLWEISTALYKSVTVEKGFVKVFYSVFSTVVMSSVVIFMFCISLVPHTVIERSIQSKLPPQIFRWHQQTDNLQLVNSYGLFRRMTGVGGRPEVIVFGSNDKVNWKEYTFLYKPGQLERRPPVVAPHQPRLDWQMWFAALGSYQHNHWFIVMLYRLLENEPTVLSLMQDNPFPHQPPKYIKAQLFTYHFSAISTRRKWWERDDYPQEYTPILTKDDKNLVAYLTQNNILPGRKRYAPYGKLDSGMRSIRAVVEGIDPALFVFSLSFLAIVNLVLLKLLRF
ncbi:LMF2 [Bugula neritina]|uniref:Lipase maturation factor n=1 Tax=Bugula neritina TaxID=10212 RepID=A0A7J7J1C4_BUGNE|nr:LMF2 [Bugula neritina]